MSTPPARRKAQATYVQARKAEGHRKVTFWITPDRMQRLDKLAKGAGSRQKALDALLDALNLSAG